MNRAFPLHRAPVGFGPAPAVRRLAALHRLDERARELLDRAVERRRLFPARREVVREGQPVDGPLLILSGWAARVRHLHDGRRQLLSFLLPGDLIGNCRQRSAVSVSTVVTLTEAATCAAPPASASPALAEAYALSAAAEEAQLLQQIARLGRMSAEERLLDLLLEFRERLDQAGLAAPDGFALPLTQETLADATGLTSVHVNRMLQQLRRQGDIVLKGSGLTLRDVKHLCDRVGRAVVGG